MFKAVLALATVMVATGGFAIFNGMGMILNERGWTQVIGGSVVLSTGLLILSLAALLAHARTLFDAAIRKVEPPRPREPRVAVPGAAVALAGEPGELAGDGEDGDALTDEAGHMEEQHG